jgi:hypothetical protein
MQVVIIKLYSVSSPFNSSPCLKAFEVLILNSEWKSDFRKTDIAIPCTLYKLFMRVLGCSKSYVSV